MINWFTSKEILDNSKMILTNTYNKTAELLQTLNIKSSLFVVFGKNLELDNLLKINNINYMFFNKNCYKRYFKTININAIHNIFFIYDLNELDYSLDVIAKALKYVKQFCNKNRIHFGINYNKNILLSNIVVPTSFDYTNTNDMNIVNDIANLNICFNINDKKKLYEYIYDVCCDYLDNEFTKNHYCDFSNNTCIANRENKTCNKDNGCCYTIKYQGYLDFENTGLCKYQKSGKCQIKSITCKLYTCAFYKKQGIRFKPNDIFLIKYFFTNKQKLILLYNFYKDKSEMINKLLEKNNVPYLVYYLTGSYYIKD